MNNTNKDKFIQYVGMPIKCMGKHCKNCKYMNLKVIHDDDENYIYCDHYEACANELLTGTELMRD